jgi:hypothetical protein
MTDKTDDGSFTIDPVAGAEAWLKEDAADIDDVLDTIRVKGIKGDRDMAKQCLHSLILAAYYKGREDQVRDNVGDMIFALNEGIKAGRKDRE